MVQRTEPTFQDVLNNAQASFMQLVYFILQKIITTHPNKRTIVKLRFEKRKY